MKNKAISLHNCGAEEIFIRQEAQEPLSKLINIDPINLKGF